MKNRWGPAAARPLRGITLARPPLRGRSRFLGQAHPGNPAFGGAEMPIWTLEPNWADEDFSVRGNYKTVIREALATNEERRRTRPRPLYDLAYGALTLSAQESSYHRKKLEVNRGVPWGCPVWVHGCRLRADALAGAGALTLDSMLDGFLTWALYALIIDRFDNYEVVTVDDYSADGLTLYLASGTRQAWTAGAYFGTGAMVYPLLYGHIPTPTPGFLTDEHCHVDVRFEEKLYYMRGYVVGQPSGEPPTPPPVEITQTTCKDTLTLTFNSSADEYLIEFAPDVLGVPGTWATYKAGYSGENDAIIINNDFPSAYWWRVTSKIGGVSSKTSTPVQSDPPTVPAPDIGVTNTADLPDAGDDLTALRQIERNPVSYRENPLITGNDVYYLVANRLDYYFDPDSPTASVITVTPPAGATVEWATDGTDPVGGDVQDSPQDNTFGCIVKARAFKDGCQSPLRIVLVDKRVDIIGKVNTSGIGSSVSTSCHETTYHRFPIPDGHGGTVCQETQSESGDSCLLTAPHGLIEQAKSSCCGSLGPAASSTRELNRFSKSVGSTGGSSDPGTVAPVCYADWGNAQENASFAHFQATHISFTRQAYWDTIAGGAGQVRSYLFCDRGGGFGVYPLGIQYEPVGSLIGTGGVAGEVDSQLTSGMLELTFPCPVEANSSFSIAQVVLTREYDDLSAVKSYQQGILVTE